MNAADGYHGVHQCLAENAFIYRTVPRCRRRYLRVLSNRAGRPKDSLCQSSPEIRAGEVRPKIAQLLLAIQHSSAKTYANLEMSELEPDYPFPNPRVVRADV